MKQCLNLACFGKREKDMILLQEIEKDPLSVIDFFIFDVFASSLFARIDSGEDYNRSHRANNSTRSERVAFMK
jgi:hypothetical protein